jgi:hypothetical protein
LEATNLCFLSGNDPQKSYAAVPFGTLAGMSNVTFTMWIYPNLYQITPGPGLLMNRSGLGGGGGLTYNGGAVNLAYQWNTNTAGTNIVIRTFDSGLALPVGVWSFCALVVSPAGANLYVCNANGLASTNDPTPLAPQTFGNDWRLGLDVDSFNPFYGFIDEVAIFGSSLSTDQINRLYLAAKTGLPQGLSAVRSGQNLVLSWSQGTLLEAPAVTGPWTTNSATSPYPVPANQAKQFYRLQIPVVP